MSTARKRTVSIHSRSSMLNIATLLPRSQSCIDDGLCFAQDRLQMRVVLEGLRINLVDVLGSGRTRGEPAACGDNFDAADRCVVARRAIEHTLDLLAGQFGALHLLC